MCGYHPRQVIEAAEVTHDRRQSRGRNGGVERREQHSHEEAAEDNKNLAARQLHRDGRREFGFEIRGHNCPPPTGGSRGGLIIAVPCAAPINRPSFVTSMRTTRCASKAR